MFLISGPTGAGENIHTRCDGVCLYMASLVERCAKQMLSAVIFAEPQRMTRVDFSFAIGEARYRVERLPKQLVAKNVVQVCVSRMLVLLYTK